MTQLNASFWLAAIAYAVGGSGLFFLTLKTAPIFSNLNDLHPIPIRVVVLVGPYGWLAVSVLGALVTLPVRSTNWKHISTILFLSLVISVLCILMFSNIETPSMIARP